jgi:hypothetical protein
MPLPDPVVLSLVQAISTVESRLQELAEIHKKNFLKTLSSRYGPEEANQGWLEDEPYLRFLITTYAGQFYGTLTRVVKILRKPPKRTVRGKKTVGYAFPVTRGHFLVTKFDTRHPLPLQVDERIAVELGRLDHRFLTALAMYRQRAVGCENYIWRSQDDTRVRARHADYDDNVFAYSRPPDDGHPGQAYGCRCTAEPVWPEELSEGFLLEKAQQFLPISLDQKSEIQRWDTWDFILHFYAGYGSDVSLSQIGLLNSIINQAQETIFPRVNDQIIQEAQKVQNGKFVYNFSNTYNFGDSSYSLNGATVSGVFEGSVHYERGYLVIFGKIDYQFQDDFTDPANIREIINDTSKPEGLSPEYVGLTDLGGNAYSIKETWSTEFEAFSMLK